MQGSGHPGGSSGGRASAHRSTARRETGPDWARICARLSTCAQDSYKDVDLIHTSAKARTGKAAASRAFSGMEKNRNGAPWRRDNPVRFSTIRIPCFRNQV